MPKARSAEAVAREIVVAADAEWYAANAHEDRVEEWAATLHRHIAAALTAHATAAVAAERERCAEIALASVHNPEHGMCRHGEGCNAYCHEEVAEDIRRPPEEPRHA